MTFVETFAPYVLHGLQWEDKHRSVQRMFERQWGHLREAVLFCVRHHDSQHTPAAQKQARLHFTEYALAVQEVWYPLPPLEQAHIACRIITLSASLKACFKFCIQVDMSTRRCAGL